MRFAVFVGLLVLLGLAVETVLALRIWVQVTGQPPTTWPNSLFIDAGAWLTQPFTDIAGSQPMRRTGVLDWSTVVAFEGYLVATLSLIAFAFIGRMVVGAVSHLIAGRRSSRSQTLSAAALPVASIPDDSAR